MCSVWVFKILKRTQETNNTMLKNKKTEEKLSQIETTETTLKEEVLKSLKSQIDERLKEDSHLDSNDYVPSNQYRKTLDLVTEFYRTIPKSDEEIRNDIVESTFGRVS